MKKNIFFLLFLIISNITNATTTYTVGASADNYTTIAAAYAACSGATDYVLEIQSDYDYSSESTGGTVTITLGALASKSASNTVTIWPASGATLSFTGTAASIFTLDAANWVIFDGRAIGSGASALTVINSSSSASKRVFTFINDASNNVIKYCLIKGDNSSTSTNTAGLILFSTTTGTTGNDSNTIDNCTIQQNSANPGCLIQSTGTSAKTNSSNTVSSCNFVNATAYSIWIDIYTDTWNITGNSFYQSAAISPSTAFYMIFVNTGGAYTITGNKFGGQAVNAGGSAFTITTTGSQISIIQFSSTCSGTVNTISNNTFSNITITTTYTAGTKISIITCQGSSNFTLGSSGNANTIGATTGTANITLTDNSASGARTFVVFNLLSTGTTNSIAYNTIGAISVGGSNTTGTITMVRNVGSGATLTVDNNTFGNTTNNNISISPDFINEWITNNGGGGTYTLTVTNNTFQNFNITSTANLLFGGIYNIITTCTLVATGNTFKNISCTTTGIYYFITHGLTGGSTHTVASTISSNIFQDLTISGTASTNYEYVIFSFTTALSTISSNTIGSTSVSNMSFKSNYYCDVIFKKGTGALTATSNIIQQFTLPNTGSNVFFEGIRVNDGIATLTSNTIRNITSTSQSSFPIQAISIQSTSNGHLITQNKISNLSATTTANVSSYSIGIEIGSSAGSGTLQKNRITTITNTKTSSTGNISGIYNFGNTSAWNYFNNVIILSNGANTNDIAIYGIGHTSTGTSLILHNTIYISGSTTSTANSFAIYDFPASGTRTIYNNILQNLRTGAGNNCAILVDNVGTWTYNYNYLEVVDDITKLTYYQGDGTYKTFAAWQTLSGYSNNKNSTISVNSTTGVVAAATSSDVFKTGANDFNANVNDDFDGTSRSNVGDGSPDGPWMGAYENTVALPIQLISFTGKKSGENNDIYWSTASELNNDYFTIEKTLDGINFETVGFENGAENSIQSLDYSLTDFNVRKELNYYRLIQTDFDGKSTFSNVISIDNRTSSIEKEVIMTVNILGQEVNDTYRGLVVIVYSDGSSIKIVQ